MGKILVYYIRSDNSVEKKKFKYKGDKLIIGKDEEIRFTPEHLFLQKRILLPPQQCLILQEGKLEPEKRRKGAIEEFFPPMSFHETSEMLKKAIGKAWFAVKPLSFNMFIILLVLQIVNIVLLFAVMKGVHIG